MNRLIDLARHLPTPHAELTVAYSPIRLPMPDRPPLELRLTAPIKGTSLPLVLFSHGHGPSNYISSKEGYAPIVQFWAERGFAVIQPTHANSRVAGLDANRPNAPFFWRERVAEMRSILDQLDEVERQARELQGRIDHSRIAVAGHSFGGHTCSLLLGASFQGETFSDPRIMAGVLLATPGRGGKDLKPEHAERFPFFDVDFTKIYTPTLVVCGGDDNPHFTKRGPEWHADVFSDAPGAEAVLTILGVGHGLGGIAGWDARETEAEVPDALETTRRLTLAWLRKAMGLGSKEWFEGRDALPVAGQGLADLIEKND